jgi:hypothetical protein
MDHAKRCGIDVAAGTETLVDDFLEGEPEVSREEGVDDRIDGRVAVAQPEQDGKDQVRDAVLAERPHQVDGEEGQPTEDEAADYQRQGFGRLGLHLEPLHLVLDVALAHTPVGVGRRRPDMLNVFFAGRRADSHVYRRRRRMRRALGQHLRRWTRHGNFDFVLVSVPEFRARLLDGGRQLVQTAWRRRHRQVPRTLPAMHAQRQVGSATAFALFGRALVLAAYKMKLWKEFPC